jgi:hypothetical protein
MKRPENNEWLDKVLTETIGSKKPRTDFENFKQKHPQTVEMLTSRAGVNSASRSPLRIRNIIMKSPITKLAAAAAIIVAVLIGIGHFGRDGSSIALADITEQFESVPFFNLTIYLSYDASAEAKKVEIWKSDDSRFRVHEENKVIFAGFSTGEINIVAFDKTTRQPANPTGYSSFFLEDLHSDGRFSLNTIISCIPSEEGITTVKTADTAASEETVVFEIKHKETPEWLSIWALRNSKLPVRMCFHDPRNGEFGDFFFDYSEQKDAKFFDPNAFTNETQEQSIHPLNEDVFNEQEIIDVFRRWTVLSGGTFPSSLGMQAIKDIDPNTDISSLYNGSKNQTGSIHFETPYATLDRDNPPSQEEMDKYFNSVIFILTGRVQSAMAGMTEWQYLGKGVKFGDANTAILWFRPKGSQTYRVIFGDLSANDVRPENLPK